MIVTISAVIYLISGLWVLFLSLGSPGSNVERILVFVSSLVCIAMGIGLLMRRNWARWLALGPALLCWTAGSLALLWGLVMSLRVVAGPSASRGLGVMMLVVLLIAGGALIWLNFRLFVYLSSDAGQEEFKTPATETGAVAKSAALQIAWVILGVAVAPHPLSGGSPFLASDTTTPDADDASWGREMRTTNAPESPRIAEPSSPLEEAAAPDLAASSTAESSPGGARESMRPHRELSAAQIRAREEWKRKSRELADRHVNDPNYTDAQFEADQRRIRADFDAVLRVGLSNPVSSAPPPAESADERPTAPIHKCRDASGGITFTQTNCPAGTRSVDSATGD